jgi:tetratricopeptide (TPR) repeat protein
MRQFSGYTKSDLNQVSVQIQALLTDAIELHQYGRLLEAERAYRQILQIESDHPEALHLLGVISHQKGHHQKALQLISEAIESEPQNHRFHSNLGLVFEALDQMPEAIQSYRQALNLNPDDAHACNNLGNALQKEGQIEEAMWYLRKALQQAPEMPEAHFNIAKILAQKGNTEAAIDHYQQAIKHKPDYEKAYNNLGNALMNHGQTDAAIKNFHKAIELKPNYVGALNNLGNALRTQNRTDEAIQIFKQAIQQTPDSAESYCHLGNAFKDQGEFDSALGHYRHAIQIKPHFAEAHFNRSIVHLLNGNFLEGWKEYEWRLQRNEWKTICSQRAGLPRWEGQSLAGKQIFVYDEQGFGDTLQFARYLPLVKDRGGEVIFETRPELMGLFKNFAGADNVIERQSYDRPVVEANFYISLLSLPGIFKTRLETIPDKIPYLFADSAKAQSWASKLSESGFKVGVVWAGQPIHGEDRNRSCTLNQFAPLLEIPGVHLIGLQKGPAAKQRFDQENGKIHFVNLGAELKDFSDTAGLIENLDLVISVDTAVAHLAGAMGKPVWVLLPFIPDWRWMMNRKDSPWYSSMRLFCQKIKDDWNSVFQQITDELRILVATHTNREPSPLTCSPAMELFRQGNRFYDRNDLSSAISAYQKTIEVKDDFFEAHFNLGKIYQDQGDLEQARANYQKALQINPDLFQACYNMGVVLQAQDKTEEAILAYQRALELKPDFAEACNNMGTALKAQGKLDLAIECFQKAIELQPAYAPAYCNIAKAFHLQGKLTEAAEYYRKALHLKPDYVEAYYGMGDIFLDQDNLTEMTRWYQKALKFTPQDAKAFNNLGKIFQDQEKIREAESCFQQAIRIKPDFAEAHFNRAITLLLAGNYAEGWQEYEWRFKMDKWKNVYPYRLEKPRWDGTSFAGKRLLVHCEQGSGDALQFARYLPRVKALGGTVIFETTQPLINIFQHFPGVDRLVEMASHQKSELEFDLYVPLLSLPGIFQTALETIPDEVPYIFADPQKKEAWQNRFDNYKFKVGIVWAGGSMHQKDNLRSCHLNQFLPLTRIPGLQIYGLQKGPASSQVKEFSRRI